eukprot:3478283-Pleurochrysis_carterae.AAC.1
MLRGGPIRSAPATSMACTHALDIARAGSPPPASVWMGSMQIEATSAGGVTSSSSATPRGEVCASPSGSHPARCARRLRALHACAACGGGCCASKAACLAWTHAATSVEIRSKRLGAYAPPKPIRRSTTTPAVPSSRHQTKHCSQRSPRWTGQKR